MSLNNLFNLIRQEDVCLWIGSGFSKYAGYPSVGELITVLYKELTQEEQSSVNQNSSLPEFTEAFVRLKNGSRNELIRILRREYLKQPVDTYLHSQLSHIPHFKTIITTNYDSLIESSYSNRCLVLREAKDIPLVTNQLTRIYKIHGDFNSENLIITSHDYSTFYNLDPKNPYWSSLTNELSTKSVAFLGYGFEDMNVWAKFENLDKYFGKNSKQRFLIAPDIDVSKQAELARNNIEYIDKTGDQFLNELTIDLKENIIADFTNGKVSVDTFTSYLSHHDLKVSIEIENEIRHLKFLQKINGITTGQLRFSTTNEKFQKLIENFRKGTGGRVLELPKSELTSFETIIEGFKLEDNLNSLDTLYFKLRPVVEKKFTIIFPKQHFEIENLEFKAYILKDNYELTTSINGFEIELIAPIKSLGKVNFTVNIKEPEIKQSVKSCIEAFKCFYYFIKGDAFKILLHDTNQTFEYKIEPQEHSKDALIRLKFYEALGKIERTHKVKFINFKSVDKESVGKVNKLLSLIDHKCVVENFSEGLAIDGDDADQFIRSFAPDGVIPDGGSLFMLMNDEEFIDLFDVHIPLGSKEIQIVNTRTRKDYNRTIIESKDNVYISRYSKYGLSNKLSKFVPVDPKINLSKSIKN